MEDSTIHEIDQIDRSPFGKLILAILPFLLMGITAVWLVPRLRQAPASDSEVILATEKFSDGSQVEILEAVAAGSLKMASRRPKSFWRLVKTNWSFTYSKSQVDFRVAGKNGVFDSVELQRKTPSLILLLRLRDAFGAEIVPDHAFFAEDGELTRIKRRSDGILDEIEKVSPAGLPHAKVEYEIEVEDGGGGWLRMTGPVAIDGEDGRSFAVAPVFPRRAPNLKLRVSQPGSGNSVVIEIPNPGHDPAGFPTWTIDPKPWRKELMEVAIVIEEISELHFSARRDFVPYPVFRIEPVKNSYEPKAFQINEGLVEDETGNRSRLFEFTVLPGTDKLRFSGTVERSRKFPWTPAEVRILAEGVRTGTESKQDLTISPEGLNLGLESMTLARVPGENARWKFAFNGKAPRRVLPEDFRIVVFRGEEATSDKISSALSGHASHRPGGIDVFEYTITWRGEISPGEKVRIGLLPDPAPEGFEFVLPVDPKFHSKGSAKTKPRPR